MTALQNGKSLRIGTTQGQWLRASVLIIRTLVTTSHNTRRGGPRQELGGRALRPGGPGGRTRLPTRRLPRGGRSQSGGAIQGALWKGAERKPVTYPPLQARATVRATAR